MGSSVFHGGFSTLLAISAMFGAKVYYTQVFYKSWVCFISAGLVNGLILQPVILSFIGPVYTTNQDKKENQAKPEATISQEKDFVVEDIISSENSSKKVNIDPCDLD